MNGEQLIKLFGDIDDKYVREAVSEESERFHRQMSITMVAAIFIIVISLFAVQNYVVTSDPVMPSANAEALPPQFSYNGGVYVYRMDLTYVFPEEVEYAGRISRVEDPREHIEFTGNVSGTIYTYPNDEEVICFRWDNWDEEADGPEPYLFFRRERILD